MRILRSGEFPSSDAAFLSLLYIPLEYLPAFPSPLRNSHINLIARTGFVTGGHYGLSTAERQAPLCFPLVVPPACVCASISIVPINQFSWFHLDLRKPTSPTIAQSNFELQTSLSLIERMQARGMITRRWSIDFQVSLHWKWKQDV